MAGEEDVTPGTPPIVSEPEYAEPPEPQPGAEGSPQEPGQPAGGAPEGAPAPKYLTEEAFEQRVAAAIQEGLGGVAGQYQSQIDQMQANMNLMYTAMNQQRRPAQPQPPKQSMPNLPDFHNMMQEGDSYGIHNMLKERDAHWQQQISDLARNNQQISQRINQEREENAIYEHFNRQTDEAARQFPIFTDPEARRYLEHQVAAVAHAERYAGRNPRGVNVLQVARQMTDHWNAMAQRINQGGLAPVPPAAAPGGPQLAPLPQPGQPQPGQPLQPLQPLPPGARPPVGAPTVPGVPPFGEIKDISDLEAACATHLPGIAEQARLEMGDEE